MRRKLWKMSAILLAGVMILTSVDLNALASVIPEEESGSDVQLEEIIDSEKVEETFDMDNADKDSLDSELDESDEGSDVESDIETENPDLEEINQESSDLVYGEWHDEYGLRWMIDEEGLLTIEDGESEPAEIENPEEKTVVWLVYKDQILSAKVKTKKQDTMKYWFYGCNNLTQIDFSDISTKNVTYMGAMFYGCSGLTSLDLSNFDTRNVTNMWDMFYGCNGLTSLDLSNFDTENVKNMGHMFDGCSGLISLDLSSFDTRNVDYMWSMFDECSGLTSLDLSNFNTGNVAYMGDMFYGCSGLTSLDMSSFDTRNVKYMGEYIGTKTVTFKINGGALKNCAVEYTNTFEYTGSEICPGSMGGVRVYAKATKDAPEKTLKEGQDYAIRYQNNVKAGKATMVITGINGYSGTIKKSFKINPCDITGLSASRVSVAVSNQAVYQKGGAKPEVVVIDGRKGQPLVLGVDYTVTYQNNKKVVNGSKQPTVKITGKGNYKGSISKAFGITNSSIANVSILATDFVYTGKTGCKAAVVLLDSDGSKLSAGKDYDKDITYQYAEDTYVKVSENGTYKDELRTAGTAVDQSKDIIQVNTRIKATVTVQPESPYYQASGGNSKDVIFRCILKDVAKANVKIPAQAFNGKEVRLSDADIVVKFGKESILVQGQDYEIVEYYNNMKLGTATVTIKGIGNYGGSKIVKFKITQRSMNYTIRYDKNDAGATGSMSDSVISTGTKLKANSYKKDGYTFVGWNTKADGTGHSYNDKETFRLKSIFQIFGSKETLYAQWKKG